MCVCVITGRSSRGAGQDARALLSQSVSAMGAQHHRRLHPLGLLQQESGEVKCNTDVKSCSNLICCFILSLSTRPFTTFTPLV